MYNRAMAIDFNAILNPFSFLSRANSLSRLLVLLNSTNSLRYENHLVTFNIMRLFHFYQIARFDDTQTI